jgi:hypothetical protein
MTKDPKIHIGEKAASSTNDDERTGYPPVED